MRKTTTSMAWLGGSLAALGLFIGCSQSGMPPSEDGDSTEPTGTAAASATGGLTHRATDAVVIVGGNLPSFAAAGTRATDVVGFVKRNGAWKQIAIQVDERFRASFCDVYTTKLPQCASATPIQTIFYADPGTFIGADPDPTFDLDDEVAFMARESGPRAALNDVPANVKPGSGVEIELQDTGQTGYVYLFERASTALSQGAGAAHLVKYTVALQDGQGNPIDYKTQYPVKGLGDCTGPNKHCDPPSLEDSIIEGRDYKRHFAARWVTDGLTVTTAGATQRDVLDLEQSRFSPTFCGRNVLSFSTAEGAFVANIEGPIRAIRSYLGANSGPFTERTHVFYESFEVEQTMLRVHAITGVMSLVDYAPQATGMTYYNSANTGGFPIDGIPDPGYVDTVPDWELVAGPYGSILTTTKLHMSADVAALPVRWYREDQLATSNDQCQLSTTVGAPDADAFGTVGPYVVPPMGQVIPITDPARTSTPATLMFERTNAFGKPGVTVTQAATAAGKAPVGVVTRTFGSALGPACGDGNCGKFTGTCGDGLCDPWEDSVGCATDCSTGAVGGAVCGDATCDPSEDALGCPEDCWTPATMVSHGVAFDDCASAACEVDFGACQYLAGCVSLIVCAENCVAGGKTLAQCQTTCLATVTAPAADKAQAKKLATCANMAACFQ